MPACCSCENCPAWAPDGSGINHADLAAWPAWPTVTLPCSTCSALCPPALPTLPHLAVETRLAPCPPDEPATQALNLAFDFLNVASTVEGAGGAASTNSATDSFGSMLRASNYSTVSYPNLPGPLLQPYSYTWLPQRTSPINRGNASYLVCPNDVNISTPTP